MTTGKQPTGSTVAGSRDYDYLFKLVIIGDSGSGKSSLLLRFTDDSFTESYLTTIGVDFRFRTVTVQGKRVKLQIWDTAGQERFRTMTSAYYRGSDGIVVVFDVTARDSFEHVDVWLAEVNRFADSAAKLLVGNKTDLPDHAVAADEAAAKAKRLGMADYVGASAKTADQVEAAFAKLAAQLIKSRELAAAATAGLAAGPAGEDRGAGFSLRDRLAETSIGGRCCKQ